MWFDMICATNRIEHRATKPNHPWTNGQVERMKGTIKQASVRRYHYDAHDQPRRQVVHDYVPAKAFRSMLGPPDVRCRDEKKKKTRSNCPQLAGEHGQKTCVAGCYRVQVSGRAIRCHILTVCGPHWASQYPAAGGGEKGKLDDPRWPPTYQQVTRLGPRRSNQIFRLPRQCRESSTV